MNQKQDTDSPVVLRLIRKKSFRSGKVLDYLKETEEGSDLAIAAIMSYYLPYCLYDSGVRGIELQRAVVDAIAQLEAQILKLKHNFGMREFPQVMLVQPQGVVSGGIAAVNPASSSFGEGGVSVEATRDEQSKQVSFKEELPTEQNLDDDNFFDDDSDVIPEGMINGDAGFRL